MASSKTLDFRLTVPPGVLDTDPVTKKTPKHRFKSETEAGSTNFNFNTLFGKTGIYLDTQVFSGSGDTLRQAMGNYWIFSEPYGALDQQKIIKPSVSNVTYELENETSDRIFQKLHVGEIYHENNTFYKTTHVPVRIIGDEEYIDNDEHWRVSLVGGRYGGRDYEAIMPDQTFGEHYHTCQRPFTEKDLIFHSSLGIPPYYVDYDVAYNYHNEHYEQSIAGMPEQSLPNYYAMRETYLNLNDEETINIESPAKMGGLDTRGPLMGMGIGAPSSTGLAAPHIVAADSNPIAKSIKLAKYDPTPLKNVQKTDYYKHASLGEEDSIKHLNNGMLKTCLDDVCSVKKYMNTYAGLQNNFAGQGRNSKLFNKFKNIIFVDENIHLLTEEVPVKEAQESFPMNIKFKFQTENSGRFVEMLEESRLTAKFVKDVYLAFTDQIATTPRSRNFVEQQSFSSYKINDEGEPEHTDSWETKNRRFNIMNILEWWTNSYAYNEPAHNENCTFIGYPNNGIKHASDSHKTFRFENSTKHLKFASMLREFLDHNDNYRKYGAMEKAYAETILYRISKRGGAPEGESKIVPTIQNFWILNTNKLDLMHFIDTQVHYDKKYVYDIYAYKLVVGTKYRYTDLRVTKALGSLDQNQKICVEFFNPETGEMKVPLVDSEGVERPEATISTAADLADLFGLEEMANDIRNYGVDTAPANLYYSKYPHLADFKINYEPSIELIEVPISRYTGQVIDNPPRKMQNFPITYAQMGNKISFACEYSTVKEHDNMIMLTMDDEEYYRKYIQSHSLPDKVQPNYNGVSEWHSVEVFRLTKPPRTFRDFSTARKNEYFVNSNYKSLIVDDKLMEDQDYYYVLRPKNRKGVVGYPSEVYHVRMHRQTDTVFPIVKVYNMPNDSEYRQLHFYESTRDFARFMRIVPNIKHRLINNDIVNKHRTAKGVAIEEFTLGQDHKNPIWNEKFKIRLTSKQTGKKIDLNLKFLLEEEEVVDDPLLPVECLDIDKVE